MKPVTKIAIGSSLLILGSVSSVWSVQEIRDISSPVDVMYGVLQGDIVEDDSVSDLQNRHTTDLLLSSYTFTKD